MIYNYENIYTQLLNHSYNDRIYTFVLSGVNILPWTIITTCLLRYLVIAKLIATYILFGIRHYIMAGCAFVVAKEAS